MIDIEQASLRRIVSALPFAEPRHEHAVVIAALDKKMNRVPVSVDAAHHYPTALVL